MDVVKKKMSWTEETPTGKLSVCEECHWQLGIKWKPARCIICDGALPHGNTTAICSECQWWLDMGLTMDSQREGKAEKALEDAIDAILSVLELTDVPKDRYRNTLTKLRDDVIKLHKGNSQ